MQCFIIILVCFSFLIVPFVTSSDAQTGWLPVRPTTSPHIVKIAEFAVDENNKEKRTKLQFKKVLRAEEKVSDGVDYRVRIQALDGVVSGEYVAIVHESAIGWIKKLVSFTKI